MIIRLVTGGIRECLMLTPIVREVHRRYAWKKRPRVETLHPEVFSSNPHVELATEYVQAENEPVVNLDVVEWPKSGKHIMDCYAEAVFGDARIVDRRMSIYPEPKPVLQNVVLTNLQQYVQPDKFQDLGCSVVEVRMSDYSITELRDLIASSRLYIGNLDDETYVAMATSTPIIAFTESVNPEHDKPFRRGVPYIAMPTECPFRDNCVEKNSYSEFGVLYGVKCSNEAAPWCCTKMPPIEVVMQAVEKVEAFRGEAGCSTCQK